MKENEREREREREGEREREEEGKKEEKKRRKRIKEERKIFMCTDGIYTDSQQTKSGVTVPR
jgi:hypothetical protein